MRYANEYACLPNDNNIARAKLIRAVIIINKGKTPGKVLVQSIQSTNSGFLPLLINIITVRVVHTIYVYCIRFLGFPTGQLFLNQ